MKQWRGFLTDTEKLSCSTNTVVSAKSAHRASTTATWVTDSMCAVFIEALSTETWTCGKNYCYYCILLQWGQQVDVSDHHTHFSFQYSMKSFLFTCSSSNCSVSCEGSCEQQRSRPQTRTHTHPKCTEIWAEGSVRNWFQCLSSDIYLEDLNQVSQFYLYSAKSKQNCFRTQHIKKI